MDDIYYPVALPLSFYHNINFHFILIKGPYEMQKLKQLFCLL